MTRWIALVALTLAACAGETRFVQPEGQDDAWLREAAVDAWAQVGVDAPSDYSLLFLDQEALQDACNVDVPEGDTIGGCSFPGVVLLALENSEERQVVALTHELGHMMRGGHDGELDHAHLACPDDYGTDVMCFRGAPVGALPTLRDAAFVTR